MGREENIEFKEAIEKRRILSFPKAKMLVGKELKEAKGDLKEAYDRFENKKYKYATITAYYSAFHTESGVPLFTLKVTERKVIIFCLLLYSLYLLKKVYWSKN